jgi:hypothetical protein
MKLLSQQALIAILAVTVLSVSIPTRAFEYPLSDEQIREAYFIGKENPDRMRAFFEPYRHTFPTSKSGPHIGLIEIETPFALIADQVSRTGLTYHAPDAVEEYLGKPEQLRVHVEIYFTLTYPSSNVDLNNPEPFWEDFKVSMRQKSEIPSLKTVGRPLWSDADGTGPYPAITGAIIDLDYDMERIDSYADAKVTVDTPDGQHVKTTFDLGRLQ